MKILISAITGIVVAGFAPMTASAADLGYYNGGYYDDRGPPPPPRVVERRYEPDYYEAPPRRVYYEPRYRWRHRHFAEYDPYWRPRRWRDWDRAYYGGPRDWDRRWDRRDRW